MNIPVSNFRRDEAYTFICGMAVAATWYLYLVKIDLIPPIKSIIEPFTIMLWLLSTATLYIAYLALSRFVILPISKNLEAQSDDDIIKEKNLKKHLALYFAGPLEEIRTNTHILGLITTSLLLLYWPLLEFFYASLKINLFLIHIAYNIITIFVYVQLYNNMRDLLIVNRLTSKGLCDTIDEKTYNQKRAEHFAGLKSSEYLDKLKKQSNNS